MNPLDIGVIAVIGLSAVFALARGFVREALSIVAWVGSGFITLYGEPTVYAVVDPMVHNPLLSQLIA
ncbi:MAG TPA: CvpA family protein, partial [Stellaceae bacterium]|nr:CvpA family protein [Stellaceae bacterium]